MNPGDLAQIRYVNSLTGGRAIFLWKDIRPFSGTGKAIDDDMLLVISCGHSFHLNDKFCFVTTGTSYGWCREDDLNEI